MDSREIGFLSACLPQRRFSLARPFLAQSESVGERLPIKNAADRDVGVGPGADIAGDARLILADSNNDDTLTADDAVSSPGAYLDTGNGGGFIPLGGQGPVGPRGLPHGKMAGGRGVAAVAGRPSFPPPSAVRVQVVPASINGLRPHPTTRRHSAAHWRAGSTLS